MSIDVRTSGPEVRAPRPDVGPRRPDVGARHPDVRRSRPEVSAAFLAEVRTQRAEALDELERAAASLDDWSLSAARGRLRDLEELLDRNDAGRASGPSRRALGPRGCA